MKYYEDIVIGEEVVFPGRYEVTRENITAVGREWDPFPFHVDPRAARDSVFGELVASTVHLFAITVKLGHTAPDMLAALSALGMNDMRNHAPARAGDVLHVRCTYLDKRPSRSRPGTGILHSDVRLYNQQDNLIFSYSSGALIAMRELPQESGD